uniref:Uncharacterized protein n=1 Tax=Cacopsylla melanoneura TaxID=428564 RepID=A0A8D8W5L8_9HEMI
MNVSMEYFPRNNAYALFTLPLTFASPIHFQAFAFRVGTLDSRAIKGNACLCNDPFFKRKNKFSSMGIISSPRPVKCGFVTSNTPVLVGSLKLSNVARGWYLDE